MIAVMGGSGNVGSKTAERLLQAGQEVRVFGRSAERVEPIRQQGGEVVVGDAMNPDDLQALFRGAVAGLVVLSDNVGDPRYAANRSTMSRASSRRSRTSASATSCWPAASAPSGSKVSVR